MVMAPSAIHIETDHNFINHDKTNPIVNNHGEHQYSPTNGLNARSLVLQVLKDQIARINTDTCDAGEEDAFFVADLGDVYRQHMRWKNNLSRVKPFYAVKCNPDPEVIRLLASLGTGFDCASKAEIDLVLGLGVDASRIIYAQPCKTKSYLRHAEREDVKQMTFDNADELHKIKKHFPGAELVLRILTDDSASLCRLSTKFGADIETANDLVHLAKRLDLNLVGVSFHVGSGASDPTSFGKAIQDAKYLFDTADELGFNMNLLDIGGGFVDETFERFAISINEALEEHFPANVRIIAEPGRYYTANAFTLATNIIARREVAATTEGNLKAYMLYMNDGVYGNFSNIIFDHQHPVPQVLDPNCGNYMTEYSIWGPTCDGIDVISNHCYLPGTIDVGDWLFFENMGAYTKCSATRFNGFTDKHETIYISSEPGASALLGY